ncbi:MAG: OmpA family protein [Chitinophagales bacterium]|nr:OmpA family protein [Chitinophagales bacterium]
MKKLLLFTTACLPFLFSSAQFFKGLRSSPYGGVTNVSYNPAIADSRFIADVNLFNFGFNLNNNYVGLDRKALLNPDLFSDSDFQDKYLKERINGKDKYVYVGAQAQLPLSFMCSWGKKTNINAFAFTSHFNSVTNVDNIDETFARIAYLGAGQKAQAALGYLNKGLNDVNPSIKLLNWIDYGLTYSRVVYDNDVHMIKAGGTLKLIQGIAGGYLYVKDLDYRWENFDTISVFKTEVNYAYSQGAVSSEGYAYDKINNYVRDLFSFKYSTPTAAVDLGVIYEWRPDKDKYKYEMDCEDRWRFDQNRYKLSAGFSIIDFGAVNFKKGEYSRNFSADITNWNVKDIKFPDGLQSFDDTIRSRFTIKDNGKKNFTMWLPTRFNLFLDYHIWKGFGVNFMADVSANMAPKRNMVHHTTAFTLTPKYDHSWFGFYLPVTYDVLGNVSLGTTLRMGPLIIGTQDLLGLFAKKHVYNADVHIALKVPIPYSKKRDRDKDGVSNRKDLCKKEKGTCATQGCPDRDGDGITDSKDKCPDEPGPVEHQGCPDTDGDGIIDREDSCVTEKGPAELHGCPDTDGDKIIDKKDDCPDDPGLPQFNGCPDRDGDGVPDKNDLCPDVPGDKDHFGCPDTDGDGVYDNEDRCIQVKGPKENFGCPWPDADGDGIPDKDDECPKVFGVIENKGCPKLEKKELETVKYAFDNLEFETNKDVIRTHSYPSLNALADLLMKKPTYGLRIEGHTDNVGTDEKNLILSQKRATAVKNYLIKRGVSAAKLEAFGYGESMPIADNDTPEGRQKNRRVEMKITFY